MSYLTAFSLLVAALLVVWGVKAFLTRWREASARVDAEIAFRQSIPAGMVWVSPEELDIP